MHPHIILICLFIYLLFIVFFVCETCWRTCMIWYITTMWQNVLLLFAHAPPCEWRMTDHAEFWGPMRQNKINVTIDTHMFTSLPLNALQWSWGVIFNFYILNIQLMSNYRHIANSIRHQYKYEYFHNRR